MTPKEQEIAIGELEERVDRLRNIYEQYFLGFEKLEPTVPRKDVDRRFAILRKEQIRNTAMRFRFQVVTQKYNTYAMHWVRICRQIEEGTYKRHIRKAKARFGDVARAGAEAERDISIDIDLDDFENEDFDAVLAEANAAAETYDRGDAADTLPPPPASSPRGIDRAAPPPRVPQMVLTTPGTSFAVAGSREVLDEVEPHTPPPSMRGPAGERLARGAALPAGSKPRILRKRDDAEPPPSGKTLPGAPPSTSRIAASPGYNPATAPRNTAPTPGMDIRPSTPRIAPIQRPGTMPSAQPSGGRMPVARPAAPDSVPQQPVARPAPSAGRLPNAAPPPAPSGGRMPVAPPAPGSGSGTDQARPHSAPGAPGSQPHPSGRERVARPAAVPPGSRPQIAPRAPGSSPQGAPRPPMPSVSDASDTMPPSADPRPSARPRLPLPSQLTRPKK